LITSAVGTISGDSRAAYAFVAQHDEPLPNAVLADRSDLSELVAGVGRGEGRHCTPEISGVGITFHRTAFAVDSDAAERLRAAGAVLIKRPHLTLFIS
jgi:hypothetical protein